MAFDEPRFENSIVDTAGDALLGHPEAIDRLISNDLDYLEIVNNWRAAHAYPLNTFQMTLRNRTRRIDSNGIVAQRIKRLSSISEKLDRYSWLKLSQMQDIAGCRVIVNSVDQVYALVDGYREYRGHKLDDEDDYIRKPKATGYRGYHLIYRYYNPLFEAYRNLKVEMQLRSSLQHCWATAVEIVDIYLREGLKSNRGSADWHRFFALMGSAIALREGCRPIPRTPRKRDDLVSELRLYVEKLDVTTRLKAFGEGLNIIGGAHLGGIKYIILVLDPSAERTLQLYGYRAAALEDATTRLSTLERYKSTTADAVLVSVSDVAQLRRAYPNYFLDTNVFLEALGEAVK